MNHLYTFFLCFAISLTVTSCEQVEMNNTTVDEVKQLIQTNHDFTIIDVRTPEEFQEGSIPGAQNIDVKNENFVKKIESLNKEDKYLLYCRSGKRSSKAYGLMTDAGFKRLTNMTGGYLAYDSEENQ